MEGPDPERAGAPPRGAPQRADRDHEATEHGHSADVWEREDDIALKGPGRRIRFRVWLFVAIVVIAIALYAGFGGNRHLW